MAMKVYYSHSKMIYHTTIESRDIDQIRRMGYDVISPSDGPTQQIIKNLREQAENDNPPECAHDSASLAEIDFRLTLVDTCDGLAFRALPNGEITAGVHKEIKRMIEKGGFVFELPRLLNYRGLPVGKTRNWMQELKGG